MHNRIQIVWIVSKNKSVITQSLWCVEIKIQVVVIERSRLSIRLHYLRSKMLTYLRNPIKQGYEWSLWPDAKFYYHYKIYRPLSFYVDWPFTARERFPQYWPSNRSYSYYWNDYPSEEAFRQIRLYNDLYFDR